MPRKCSITPCSSKTKYQKVILTSSSNNRSHAWHTIIQSQNGNEKCKISHVCSEHFLPEDLIAQNVIQAFGGTRQRVALKKGAIPSVFEMHTNIDEPYSVQNSYTKSFRKQLFENQLPLTKRVCLASLPELKEKIYSFETFLKNSTDVLLPIGWKLYTHIEIISIYKLFLFNLHDGTQIFLEKQIVFCPKSDITYYVNKKKIEPAECGLIQLIYPFHISEVINAVKLFYDKIICQGGPKVIHFPDGDGYRGEDGDGNEARKKTVTGMKNGETNILHMDEASQMSQNQVRILQEQLACQGREKNELLEKLCTYDEDMAKKEELQKRVNELQRWIEDTEINMKKTKEDQANIIECQFKKLEKLEKTEVLLRADNDRLENLNDCQTGSINTLERNEQRLNADIKKLEMAKSILENELCEVKNQLREKTCMAEKLTKSLKIKQDELLCVRKQLGECQTTVEQLKERCKNLETDLACTKAKLEDCQAKNNKLRERCRELEKDLECMRVKLEDVKSNAAAMEARLKAEADVLTKELDCRARKLREVEAERDEARRRVSDEQCKVNRLEIQVAELRAAGERERTEAEAREQRLKRDACERDEEVRRLNEQLAALRRENEEAACEVAAHKTRARASECLLENAKRSAEARDRAHEEVRDRLEREKTALSCEVQQKITALAELERQVCRMRDELRRAGASSCCGGGSRSTSSGTTTCAAPPKARADACNDSGVIADDSFISGLKRLYCDLDTANKRSKSKTRRH